jgi:hypothetical protein
MGDISEYDLKEIYDDNVVVEEEKGTSLLSLKDVEDVPSFYTKKQLLLQDGKRTNPFLKELHGNARLNSNTYKLIMEGLLVGLGLQQAASRAVISKTTVYEWYDKGQKDLDNGIDSRFARFYAMVEIAKTTPEYELTNVVIEKSKQDAYLAFQYLKWKSETDKKLTGIQVNIQNNVNVAGNEEVTAKLNQARNILSKAKSKIVEGEIVDRG